MFKVLVLSLLVPLMTPTTPAPVIVSGAPIVASSSAEDCTEDPCFDMGVYSELPSEPPSSAPQLVTAPSAPPTEAAPELGKIIQDGGKAVAAVKDAASGGMVKVATAISLVLFFFIGLLRKFGPAVISGNHIRIITVAAGAVAALAGYVASGLPLEQVFQLFMAGPGALAINELVKYFRKPESVA